MACTDDEATARRLLEAGADPDIESRWEQGLQETPLHRAAHYGSVGLVKLLCEFGAAVDKTDNDNDTPLMRALEHPSAVAALLECSANPCELHLIIIIIVSRSTVSHVGIVGDQSDQSLFAQTKVYSVLHWSKPLYPSVQHKLYPSQHPPQHAFL